jgi:hypothetical protein
MAGHFESEANKKLESDKKEMENDPVMKTIQNDPQVKEILQDPDVIATIHKLQTQGGLDFHNVAKQNPDLGKKLMVLIQKGVFNTQTTMPGLDK